MRSTQAAVLQLTCVVVLALVAGCSPAGSAVTPRGGADPSQGKTVLSVPPMDGTGSAGRFASLKSNADTKLLPKSVMVYKVKPANVTTLQVETLARNLCLTGQV